MSTTPFQHADFTPPRTLRNAHVQSSLLSLPAWRWPVLRQSALLRANAQNLILQCTDGVRLDAWYSLQTNHAAPWVIVLHGWLGDANSSYVLSLGAQLYAQGYHVLRLNLRDHGGTEHLNAGLFHSCLLEEVIDAVRLVQQRFAITDLALAGFSLGGNFALRVAARAHEAGIELRRVVAICPALNPHASDAALMTGPLMYRRHFMENWKRSLRAKQRWFPQHYDLDDTLKLQSLTELTDVLVQRHAGFVGVRDYYDGYSLLGNTLRDLRVESRVLIALDDPIVPASDVQHLADSPCLQITTSAYGGHCGFIANWAGKRWANDWSLRQLR